MKKELYIVVTGEDGESGTGGFVHLVTADRKKAVRELRKVVSSLGYERLKRGTNDGDERAEERYDRDGMHAHVYTYGNGLSFGGEVKTISEDEFEKETCI